MFQLNSRTDEWSNYREALQLKMIFMCKQILEQLKVLM